jgi:hypothetical protein
MISASVSGAGLRETINQGWLTDNQCVCEISSILDDIPLEPFAKADRADEQGVAGMSSSDTLLTARGAWEYPLCYTGVMTIIRCGERPEDMAGEVFYGD